MSWANIRLGVPARLDCQSWLSLPDILLFVLLHFLKKSFQVLVGFCDFLLKMPKMGSFVKWCTSIIVLRIFNISKLSSSVQCCKKKGLGFSNWLYLVKNQFVTAKWCMWIFVSEFFEYKFVLDLKIWLHFIWQLNLVLNQQIIKWLILAAEWSGVKICRDLHFTIAYISKLSSSMQWCKKKFCLGHCKGLYLVKNRLVTAKWCMWIVVSEFFKMKICIGFKNMAPFHLAAEIGHFFLFN